MKIPYGFKAKSSPCPHLSSEVEEKIIGDGSSTRGAIIAVTVQRPGGARTLSLSGYWGLTPRELSEMRANGKNPADLPDFVDDAYTKEDAEASILKAVVSLLESREGWA